MPSEQPAVPRLPARVAGLSLADWGIVAAAVLLDLSLVLPWLRFGPYVVRPAELRGGWVLVGVLAFIVVATVVAGRWPYTRWLALVPLVGGCLLLGVLGGAVGAVLVLNPLLARLPWQEANELAQAVSRVADLLRLSNESVARVSGAVSQFALEPGIVFAPGSWLFGASALALIVVGYRKIVERFAIWNPAAAPDVPGTRREP
jgi:hypothetical protein